ncbi:phosphoribosylformylglycinamidine cyclo-ligase [Francisella adeliensis]|uniref:Phosphoribosylformylglycinamidine cyclo-ligase n=1 Tax=Francisella adeliensis TaxID=2007306 RepID=A0A2Z4XXC9_9GAMM|nr:phosphoribosylformylglycinamidine cyclo-ligase [Francisella adeliensis]AXA33409.1 phosphoribosylformylglycinamidine cyclo-ligase [Francisella adeliensis]MBK2085426.1 phosphoribosylformylglycinamidine cyclo-ligase [Francisella adeliensis]MBK2097156.1 phosphoribosylformylglycinamidine cyclo-ligase [Francisella adeliensis]QIW11637.1 phosphoribosylformylglycinamidine cyclo-ligase [Francisella adeliensis]QIW13512.1 phosphoribosylformylglycinamidine cyclo-ligase [Francisella adeliensis]
MASLKYEDAGVNIEAGNEAVDRMKNHVKKTFTKDVLTGLGSFGSLYSLKDIINNYEEPVLVQSIDGVGTKTKVAVMCGKFENLGYDLFSAATNDIVVMGAKPITFLDYVAHDKLDADIMEELVKGMSKACAESGVSLVGGETAEMPGVYQAGEIDMVGVITGVVDKNKVINGENIQEGDVVFGLSSSGLHTNGYSFARKLFFDVAGKSHTDTYPEFNGKTIGDVLLEPHINYTNIIHDFLDNGVDIKGIAHITGGGFIENIPRVLPKGLGAKIEKNSFETPAVFKVMQQIGDISEFEMYRSFNMGIGMTVIASQEQYAKMQELAKKHTNTKLSKIGTITTSGKVEML